MSAPAWGGDALPLEYFLAGDEKGVVSSAHVLADARYHETARLVFWLIREQGVDVPTVDVGLPASRAAAAAQTVVAELAASAADELGAAKGGFPFDASGTLPSHPSGHSYDDTAAAHAALPIDDLPSPSALSDGFGTFFNPDPARAADVAWAGRDDAGVAEWAAAPTTQQAPARMVYPPNYASIEAVMRALGHAMEGGPGGRGDGADVDVDAGEAAWARNEGGAAMAHAAGVDPGVARLTEALGALHRPPAHAAGRGATYTKAAGAARAPAPALPTQNGRWVDKLLRLTEASGAFGRAAAAGRGRGAACKVPTATRAAAGAPVAGAAAAGPKGTRPLGAASRRATGGEGERAARGGVPLPPQQQSPPAPARAGCTQTAYRQQQRLQQQQQQQLCGSAAGAPKARSASHAPPPPPPPRRGRDYTQANRRIRRRGAAQSDVDDVDVDDGTPMAGVDGPAAASLSEGIIGRISQRDIERDVASLSTIDVAALTAPGFAPLFGGTFGTSAAPTRASRFLAGDAARSAPCSAGGASAGGVATLSCEAALLLDELWRANRLPQTSAVAAGVLAVAAAALEARARPQSPPEPEAVAVPMLLAGVRGSDAAGDDARLWCGSPQSEEVVLPGMTVDDASTADGALSPTVSLLKERTAVLPVREGSWHLETAAAAAAAAAAHEPPQAFFPCDTWAGARPGYYFGRAPDGRLGYHLDAPEHPRVFMRYVLHLNDRIARGDVGQLLSGDAAGGGGARRHAHLSREERQAQKEAAEVAELLAAVGQDVEIKYVDMLQFRGFLRTLPEQDLLPSELHFLDVSEAMRQRSVWVAREDPSGGDAAAPTPDGLPPLRPLAAYALHCCDVLRDPVPTKFRDPLTHALIIDPYELLGRAYDVTTIIDTYRTPRARMTREQRRLYKLLTRSDFAKQHGSDAFGDLTQCPNCVDFGLEYSGVLRGGDAAGAEAVEASPTATADTDDEDATDAPVGADTTYELFASRMTQQMIEECLCQRVYRMALKDRKHLNDTRFCEAIVDDLLTTVTIVANLERIGEGDDTGDNGEAARQRAADAALSSAHLVVKQDRSGEPGRAASGGREADWRGRVGCVEASQAQRLDDAIRHCYWEQQRPRMYQQDSLWTRRRFRRRMWSLAHNTPEDQLMAHLRDCCIVQRLIDRILALNRTGIDWSPTMVVTGRRRIWHCLAQIREFFNIPNSVPELVVFQQLPSYRARAVVLLETWAQLAPGFQEEMLDLDYDSFAECEDDATTADAARAQLYSAGSMGECSEVDLPALPSWAGTSSDGSPPRSYREALGGMSRGESRERQKIRRPMSRPVAPPAAAPALTLAEDAPPTAPAGDSVPPRGPEPQADHGASPHTATLLASEEHGPSLTRSPRPDAGGPSSVLSAPVQRQILASAELGDLQLDGWADTPTSPPRLVAASPPHAPPPAKRGRPPGGRRTVPAPPRHYANCRGGTGGSFRAVHGIPRDHPPPALAASAPAPDDDASTLSASIVALVVTSGTSPRARAAETSPPAGADGPDTPAAEALPPPALPRGAAGDGWGAGDAAAAEAGRGYVLQPSPPREEVPVPSRALVPAAAAEGRRVSEGQLSVADLAPRPLALQPSGSCGELRQAIPALRLWREEHQRKAARMKLADILRKGRRRPFWYEKEGVTPAAPGESVLDRCSLAQPVAHPAQKMPYAAALLLQSIGWTGHHRRQQPFVDPAMIVCAAVAVLGAVAATVPMRRLPPAARRGSCGETSASMRVASPPRRGGESREAARAVRELDSTSALPTLVASAAGGGVVSVVAAGQHPPQKAPRSRTGRGGASEAGRALRGTGGGKQHRHEVVVLRDQATALPLRTKREAGAATFPAVDASPADRRRAAPALQPQRTAATVPGPSHAPDLSGTGRAIPLDKTLFLRSLPSISKIAVPPAQVASDAHATGTLDADARSDEGGGGGGGPG